MTTKILALTDALGNLVRFVLLPGHRFDTVGVAPLIDGLTFEGFIADKAFDSNSIIADLNERGAKIVISQHPRRASPLPIDAEIYKWRHLIENFFCKLKEFKRIAMRADKTDQSFAANIYLAAAVINSRWISTGPRANQIGVEPRRFAKNAKISSRAAMVGWPAWSIRCAVTTLWGQATRSAKNGATSVLAALSGRTRPTKRSPSAAA